jgi:sugar phosphate permease
VLYVGVYIGGAISGQIATAFMSSGTSWRVALRAIGITGIVVAVLLEVVLREPKRSKSLRQLEAEREGEDSSDTFDRESRRGLGVSKLVATKDDLVDTISYILRLHSFWLLVLSAGFRQLSGNVFGHYMPSYLSTTYSSHDEILSRYDIIVGVVGSVAVLSGGILTSVL